MRRTRILALSVLLLAGATPRSVAGPPSAPEEARTGPRLVEVVITEGTNVAAALSPDGSTLALDLLGRVWTLPAAGGRATPLTDAMGDARQPAWTPDGERVVFQAYWDGNYHVWSVAADGSDLRQHTFGPWDDREPHVSPDGRRIAFSSDRGGSYDLWEVDLAGGIPRRLTDEDGEAYAPAWAPDGSRIAYVAEVDGGTEVRVRQEDGRGRTVARTDAQAHAPAWSPDGGRLSWTEIGSGRSRLVVAPATGGEPTIVSADGEDVFPFRASWRMDGRLVYTGDGRVRVGRADGGAAREVPFEALVRLDRPTYRRRLRDFDGTGPRRVRGIVSPAVSPDGASVAFSALGDLWVLPVAGTPRRITDDAWIETDPAWSPDGRSLAFAADRGGATGLWVREVATGEERRVTPEGTPAAMPSWSPDGSRIAFVGGEAIKVVDASGGAVRTLRQISHGAGRPAWSRDGRWIAASVHWPYSTRFREGVNRVLVLPATAPATEEDADRRAPGGARITPGRPVTPPAGGPATLPAPAAPATALAGGVGPHLHAADAPAPSLQEGERLLDLLPHGSVGTRGTDGPAWSPDGRWLAYVSAGVLWVAPVAPDGEPVGPPRRLTNDLADDPTWTGDSRSLVFLGAGGELRRVDVLDGGEEAIPLELTWRRVVPEGGYTIHAGRMWDGRSEALQRDVDVVVEGHRILRVEDHDPALHAGRVVDATGGTLMPGLIEMHTHGSLGGGEAVGRQWLAWGVTATREPAGDAYDMVARREATAAGRRLGPRVFGTGGTVDGSRIYYDGAAALASTAQVDLELERARALDYDLVKTYVRLPDAVQARVVREAHAMGMPVTSHELYPAVAVGADGVEHVRGTSRRGYSPKVSELNRSYQDVVELLARSGMTLTPTVGIYGGFRLLVAERPEILDDARVDAFSPGLRAQGGRGAADRATQRRLVSDMAGTARRVVEAGGRVVAGTDAPIIPYGLSLHAELEAYVRYGGMRPVDALRAATSVAAEALGAGEDLGAVEPGRLADLLVVEGDPLQDVTAAGRVRTVIADGRVHALDALLRRP